MPGIVSGGMVSVRRDATFSMQYSSYRTLVYYHPTTTTLYTLVLLIVLYYCSVYYRGTL